MTANPSDESSIISGPQRASVLVGVPKLLRDFGVSADAVRDGMEFDSRVFEDPDMRLPYAMVGRILDRCAQLTGCEHFGLLLGAAHDHAIMGLPGAFRRPAWQDALKATITGGAEKTAQGAAGDSWA
jgi:hypothetical protein